MQDHRIVITYAGAPLDSPPVNSGDTVEQMRATANAVDDLCEAVLGAWETAHSQFGPVSSFNTHARLLSITIAVDHDLRMALGLIYQYIADAREAFENEHGMWPTDLDVLAIQAAREDAADELRV